MKLICLIVGCLWEDANALFLGNEPVLRQCCRRCGSSRIKTASTTPAASAG